ncbi:nucleotide exchange factor GrpE [Dawidia soli]|uniref:Protein GrpE n=1 Tax=Dawidia soli TaxID=2782352 RepID=A0AAP2DG80_9BACT|nr:nucleotide exchange factor GrpE [Dawidia soli]MBT1690115.1 nucleotide exchange factor GrpE [Dawidia soli]
MQQENKDQREELNQNKETISDNTVEMADAVKGADNAEEDLKGGDENGGLVKLQAELAEQKDKYIRLYSEFENFRRRTAKEKIEMISSANETLIKSLLPVADDFERAEKSFKDRNDKELEGFFLIYNKFKKVLEQYGVKVMELGPGSEFNVDVHEAITQIPAPDEKLKGKIVDVVEKGYLQNDKVIRFAKVVVGS